MDQQTRSTLQTRGPEGTNEIHTLILGQAITGLSAFS
jgi:hypothetical protein